MGFLTDQSWRVLKSWYTGGDPEQGFRRWFADGVNQSLVSSVEQATIKEGEERKDTIDTQSMLAMVTLKQLRKKNDKS